MPFPESQLQSRSRSSAQSTKKLQKAINIGMIPPEFADKIEAIGNSSLGISAKYLLEKNGAQRMTAIGSSAIEINLSADKGFNDFYVENMLF